MRDKVKNTYIVIAIVLAIAMSFLAGYMSNSGRYDIVDKQDELSVLYDTTQEEVITILADKNELASKYLVMMDIENLTDAESAEMASVPKDLEEFNKLIINKRIYMNQLKFTYGVLQKMR